MNLTWYFCALWLSEIWYEHWGRTGDLSAKARALVIFDRVMDGRIKPTGRRD